MNRYQKIAWFNLIVIAVTIIVTSIAVTIEFRMRGYSEIGLWFVGILVLLQYTPKMFKKPQSEGGVVSDERDTLIVKRALSFAYTSFWIVFAVSSLAVHILKGMGPDSSIPTITLPLMVFAGALFMKIVCSVAILVQYGRGNKGDKS